jgi:hypothetical protein
MSAGFVTTRAQKRRMGQRDLWGVIVNNDDVCFKYILPRLSGTDVKFLFEVNSETRALVKRSSRARDLYDWFRIKEMLSISTLEIAWENQCSWPNHWDKGDTLDERYFCRQVAQTNKLELLKWVREEKKCEWSEGAICAAAQQGNLEMVKYCVVNHCPKVAPVCELAAKYGNLECLKYLHEEVKAPWNWQAAAAAAEEGHLHILEYLFECKYDRWHVISCLKAAENGQIDCLKFLHETAKAPWDERAVWAAHHHNHSECVQYLLDNDCPLLPGWRYEHGILHTL